MWGSVSGPCTLASTAVLQGLQRRWTIRIHRMHFSVNDPRPRQLHLSDGSLLAGSAEAQNSVPPRSHAPILPRIRGISPMISGSEASFAGRESPTCNRPARGHGNRILTMGVCLRRSAWQTVRAPALPRFHSRTHLPTCELVRKVSYPVCRIAVLERSTL